MLKLILPIIALLLLESCSSLKNSTSIGVAGAKKDLVQYVTFPLNIDVPKNTDWNNLRIEATNARLLRQREIPYHGQKICPIEGKKCGIRLYQINDSDTITVGFTEYRINPLKPKATILGVSGRITLTRAEVKECRGLKLEFEGMDVVLSGGAVSYDIEATIKGKVIRKTGRGDRFSQDILGILWQNNLSEFKIENIKAKYGCSTKLQPLKPIIITIK